MLRPNSAPGTLRAIAATIPSVTANLLFIIISKTPDLLTRKRCNTQPSCRGCALARPSGFIRPRPSPTPTLRHATSPLPETPPHPPPRISPHPKARHVQQNPNRQSRRNRRSHSAHLPRTRHPLCRRL